MDNDGTIGQKPQISIKRKNNKNTILFRITFIVPSYWNNSGLKHYYRLVDLLTTKKWKIKIISTGWKRKRNINCF